MKVRKILNYKPAKVAVRVIQPTLIVAAELDSNQAVELYEVWAGDKDFYLVTQAKHYDLYEKQIFSEVISRQIDSFKRYIYYSPGKP